MDCAACQTPNVDGARFCAKCGAPQPEAPAAEPDPLIGTVIGGRFRVVGILGEGGMGRVYAAEQQMGTSVRKAAVKMLLAQFAKDPQVVERFMRECGTVSELEHPNTIKVYDYGQTADGDLYIAMELLAGASLEKTLEQGPLPAERVDRIVAQVCGSLQEAHDKGIVHRDLKPANIYLTKRGSGADYVKVLDFGIAKRDDKGGKEAKLTQQGTVLGTPPYMSPEQFRGQELDARSDIYSLGVMSYEMLTGRLPFDADTPWAWATQHMTAQPFPFETVPLGSAVPAKMKTAVMRALSKDKNHRPQTVTEFYQEFTIAGHPMEPGPASMVIPASAVGSYAPGGSGTSAILAAPSTTESGIASSTSSMPHSYPPPIGADPASGVIGGAPSSTYASSPAMAVPAGAYPGAPQVPTPPPPAKRSSGALIGGIAAVLVVGALGTVMVLRRGSGSGQDKADASAHAATAPSATTSAPDPKAEEQADGGPAKLTPEAHLEACHHAESAAGRDNLAEARHYFTSCDGPGRAGATRAIEAAEARLRRPPPPPPPCRGRHCPRLSTP